MPPSNIAIILPAGAWEADPFWRDAVAVLTGGRKLRAAHYLETLTAEDLAQLRQALSSPLPVKAQQALCPPRRGGETAGELPHRSLLGRIAAALRQAQSVRDLQVSHLVESARERCEKLGIDTDLTNQVMRLVAGEVLEQKTKAQVGASAIAAGRLLLLGEAVRSKAQQEQEKIRLRERAEDRQAEKLQLEWEKYRFDAALACREKLPELKAIESSSELTEAEKTAAFVEKLFGKKPDWLP